MAKRKTVNIGIQFPTKNEATKQLNDLISSLNKMDTGIKIDLDTTKINKTFSGLESALDNITKKIKELNASGFNNVAKDTEEATKQQIKYQKVFGKSLNIGDGSKGFSELNAQADLIRNTVDEMAKVTYNLTKNKALKDATITYVDNMGKVVTETMKWKEVSTETEGVIKRVFTTTNLAVSDNVQKLAQLQEKVELTKSTLQNKLNKSKDNGFIDTDVLSDIQKKLNAITTDTSTKEINELKTAINNLSSSDSQIVRVQNKILSMEKSLVSLKTKYEGLVGNKDSKQQLIQYENELNKLKITLDNLMNGKSVNGAKISSQINMGTQASRDLTNAVKGSDEALKLATKDAQTFGGAFKQMATKIGMASVSYEIFNQIRKSIRDGIEAVKDMDSAMTTLKITMDGMTDTGLSNMVKQSQELATNLSSTTSKVLEAVQTFANASETIDTIMAKTSSAIILSNLTGLDTKDTVNTIQSATKQFEELSDGSEKSSMKVTDSMVAISRALGMDFSEGVRQMSQSVEILGSLADQVGLDLDDTLGLISSGMEKMRISGDEYATAMKTIISRTYRLKDADPNATESDYLKAEKALKQQGITIRKNNGEMQDYMTTLRQINEQWGHMSEAEQLALGDALGGARQLSIVLSSIKNMPRTEELINIGKNSEGEGLKAQAIWAESLEARLQSLTNSSQIFWQNFFNSDLIKNSISLLDGLVKGLTDVQKTFGSLSLTVGLVSSAFLMFTNNPLKKLSQDAIASGNAIKTLGSSFRKTSTDANISSKGIEMLGFSFDLAKIKAIGLQAVLSMGLSLALTAVISLTSKLIGWLFGAGKTMEDCSQQAKTLQESLTGFKAEDDLVAKYKELSKELENSNLKEDERKALNDQISQIKSELIGIEDDYYGILNNENLTLEEQLERMKLIKQERLKKEAKELDGNMVGQSDMEKKAKEVEMYANEIKNLQEVINNTSMNGKGEWKGELFSRDELSQYLEGNKQKFQETKFEVDEYNSKLALMKEANYSTGRSVIELGDTVTTMTNTLRENTQAKEENANVEFQHMSQDEAVENIKKATQEYGKANSEANKLRETIYKINKDGLSADIITDLAENYSELGAKINDAGAVQDFLNQKLVEQTNLAQEAYSTMLMNDSEFYQSKISNNDEFQNAFNVYLNNLIGSDLEANNIQLDNYTNLLDLKNDLQNRFGDATGEFLNNYCNIFVKAYTFDSTQYADLQTAKTGYLNSTLGAVAQWASQFVSINAQSYTKDLQQFNSLSDAKAKVLSDLNARMKVIQQNYNDLLSDAKAKADEFGDPTFNNSRGLAEAGKQLREIQGAIAGVDVAFSGLEVGFNKISANFNSGAFKGANIGSGKGSDSKSGGKSGTEKQVEDIENLADRYYELDNALKDVENDLSNINTLEKNAKGKEKNRLLQEEVVLLNKKRSALQAILDEKQREKQDYRNALYSQGGFTFNGDDSIHNYMERMEGLR